MHSQYKLEFLLQVFESGQQSWENNMNTSEIDTEQISRVNDDTG